MPTKTPSIISTVLTVLSLLVFVIASLFFSLVALNGFSESQGTPALIASLICNGIGIILAAVVAWRMPAWLIHKFSWKSLWAVLVSLIVSFFLGGGISIVAMFVSILVADILWNVR